MIMIYYKIKSLIKNVMGRKSSSDNPTSMQMDSGRWSD